MELSKADPAIRLEALQVYMDKWIDEWPRSKQSFTEFFKKRYSYVIPDTIEYVKNIATHCFYCKDKLVSGRNNFESPRRSSIDHYLPQVMGKTEKFVICCAQCNTNKGATSPAILVSRITKALITGKPMWGFHGKKLKFMGDQIQKITNDMLWNMGPVVYYIKK